MGSDDEALPPTGDTIVNSDDVAWLLIRINTVRAERTVGEDERR